MDVVTVDVAASTLSQLLARVEAGEEVVLARGKTPVAKLVPYGAPMRRRAFGAWKGRLSVGSEFFEPCSQDDLEAWGS